MATIVWNLNPLDLHSWQNVHLEVSAHWLCINCLFPRTLPADNGLNPVWVQKQFVFDIHNPTFSFLRFTVYEEDMFSDPNFLAQATYPVRLLRTGECGIILIYNIIYTLN